MEPVKVDLRPQPKPRRPLPALLAVLLLATLGFFAYQSGFVPVLNKYQAIMDEEILPGDPRNAGMKVALRTDGGALHYDLIEVAPTHSPADVFRVLLMTASRLSEEGFSSVVLARQGTSRFRLEGAYFAQLGRQYEAGENPIYLIRTFPENVRNLDGTPAFSQWEGGLLGVTAEQMEDFNTFTSQWIGY